MAIVLPSLLLMIGLLIFGFSAVLRPFIEFGVVVSFLLLLGAYHEWVYNLLNTLSKTFLEVAIVVAIICFIVAPPLSFIFGVATFLRILAPVLLFVALISAYLRALLKITKGQEKLPQN
ncbi:MAG: hypothetical protein AB1485_07445 [Candidatus Thermoplasmatota archaeon]